MLIIPKSYKLPAFLLIMESLHGMEVIKFIKSSELSEDSLLLEITEKFGDAIFHVCSKSDLSAQELLYFLKEKEKLVFKDGIATINCDGSCFHD